MTHDDERDKNSANNENLNVYSKPNANKLILTVSHNSIANTEQSNKRQHLSIDVKGMSRAMVL